jgi:hypothetical protein
MSTAEQKRAKRAALRACSLSCRGRPLSASPQGSSFLSRGNSWDLWPIARPYHCRPTVAQSAALPLRSTAAPMVRPSINEIIEDAEFRIIESPKEHLPVPYRPQPSLAGRAGNRRQILRQVLRFGRPIDRDSTGEADSTNDPRVGPSGAAAARPWRQCRLPLECGQRGSKRAKFSWTSIGCTSPLSFIRDGDYP